MNRRAQRLLPLLLSAALWACGDGSTAGPPAGAAGEAAAARGLSEGWALLSVPAGGGSAALHPLADPGRELWSGAVPLPAAEGAVRLAPRLVAVRATDGSVHRYDPAEGAVTRLGELPGEALWHGGREGGVWSSEGQGGQGPTLWTLSAESSERRTVDRPVRWAAPGAEGVTVALLGSDPATLARWPAGADAPDASLELEAGPPAVITALGRIAVLTRTDETGVLQTVSVADMEAGERIEVGGPVTAVAASPSSHQLYVAVDDPPRLIYVDRFGGGVRTRARPGRAVREIRPGAAGGPPVIWDGQSAHLVPWGGGDPVRVETSWRADLPLSLPDGSVLVLRDGDVLRTRAEGDGAAPSAAGSGDRIWVPIRWRAETERASAVPDTSSRDDTAAGDAVPPDTAAAVEPAGGAADSARADTAGLDPELEVTSPGFYAVLGWSRSPGELRDQLDPVREAGFPVAAQTRRDDADTLWYRGLVGPYARRERAEQVARTLQREHGVEGWVQELRPGLVSDEVLR